MSGIDKDGQPLNRAFNALRLQDRAIDELLGISKGIILDKVVNQKEAENLVTWIEVNCNVINKWPAKALYGRIKEMLADGVLDDDEKIELFDLLSKTTGGVLVDKFSGNFSTALPLDDPPPRIIFEGRCFCLTGKFFYGGRRKCEQEIIDRGGFPKSSPSRKTDYLVIGEIGSTDWIHSTHGRKIEKAMELRDAGQPLAIVSEKHWIDHILEEI